MKAVCVVILLLTSTLLRAQITVSGEITYNMRWSGKVFVTGDIVVQRDVTLTIEPGSQIILRANQDDTPLGKDQDKIEIIVLGVLQADGGKEDGQITFTTDAASPQAGDWYGIVLKNLSTPSILQNCIIEYAYKGITCYGSSPEIINCEVRFNLYAGISCEIRSATSIKKCILMGNQFAGLIVELASTPIVEQTVITQNKNGALIFDRSRPDLGHLPAQAEESSGENQFFNNTELNIYNKSSNDIFAQNNIWDTENSIEIQKTIVDKTDDPSHGMIIFEPIFGKRSPLFARQPETQKEENRVSPEIKPIITPSNSADTRPREASLGTNGSFAKTSDNNTPVQDTIKPPPASSLIPLRNAVDEETTTAIPDTSVLAVPETLLAYRDIKVDEAPKTPTPDKAKIQEPVLEGYLDRGKRHYARMVKPKYPSIYQRTGHQGQVIMEVIVGRDGSVEGYKILRSNGEYFSAAAEEAIKKMRYEPETFQGEPVSFRIYETFIFKLKN